MEAKLLVKYERGGREVIDLLSFESKKDFETYLNSKGSYEFADTQGELAKLACTSVDVDEDLWLIVKQSKNAEDERLLELFVDFVYQCGETGNICGKMWMYWVQSQEKFEGSYATFRDFLQDYVQREFYISQEVYDNLNWVELEKEYRIDFSHNPDTWNVFRMDYL